MTAEEAKANQDRLVKMYGSGGLGWWYGTRCKKCCGVYPKFEHSKDLLECRYECEVCHKQTAHYSMPWLAERAWNEGKLIGGQMNIFSFMEAHK